MRSRSLLVLALAAALLLLTPGSAEACCTPCDSICATGAPADTVCCTGQPTTCDACGLTACGACAQVSKLDTTCASECAKGYLECAVGLNDPGNGAGGCAPAWGACMDGCWQQTLVCETPPCATTCEDDAHEQDDTFEAAKAASPIMNVAGGDPTLFPALVSAPFDDDWFHAYGDCCHTVWMTITWDPDLGDLDLVLHDAEGKPMGPGDEGYVASVKPGFIGLRRAGYGGHFYARVSNEDGACVPYKARIYAPVYLD